MSYRSSYFLLITASLLVVIAATHSFQMVSYVGEDTQIKLVFSYGVGARNVLDTFSKTFTKDMIGDPPITIRMWLTEEENSRIEDKLNEIGFFDRGFTKLAWGVGVIGEKTPYSTFYLKVQYGLQVKELKWADRYIFFKDDKVMSDLNELNDLIQSIIMAKPEYQKLPEPRGAYS